MLRSASGGRNLESIRFLTTQHPALGASKLNSQSWLGNRTWRRGKDVARSQHERTWRSHGRIESKFGSASKGV